MPSIADYVVLGTTTVRLDSLTNDHEYRFAVPSNFDASKRAVLTFRVRPVGKVTLRFRANTTNLNQIHFDTKGHRTWSQVVPANSLKPSGNLVMMSVPQADEGAFVEIDDVVLFVQVGV
jgi:hypothetical protein